MDKFWPLKKRYTKPCAAPNVFPYRDHRNMEQVLLSEPVPRGTVRKVVLR